MSALPATLDARTRGRLPALHVLIALGIGVGVVLSLSIGSHQLGLGGALDQLFAGPGDPGAGADVHAHRIVWEQRLPRTVLALAVGAALGMAGAVMQTLTRNPLADPGILGINSGAAVAVAVGLVLGLASTPVGLVGWAMAGAAVAAMAVYTLGTVGGATSPVRLALAGMAISAVLVGVTSALAVSFPSAFDLFRFWAVGAFEGRGWDVVWGTCWFIVAGGLLAIVLGPHLDLLASGDDAARALGLKVGWARLGAAGATTLLCGAAVAAAGPIGFVGLIVPHVVRSFTGPASRPLLLGCAGAGAVLVLAADILGRIVARPGELEAGIVTALIGGPVFIALVRKRELVSL